MKVILEATEVPDSMQYVHIINNADNETWDCWALIKEVPQGETK